MTEREPINLPPDRSRRIEKALNAEEGSISAGKPHGFDKFDSLMRKLVKVPPEDVPRPPDDGIHCPYCGTVLIPFPHVPPRDGPATWCQTCKATITYE